MLCNFYYWVSLIGGSDHFQMQSVVEYNLHVKFVSCTPLDYKKSSLIYCFRNRSNSKIEHIATHTRKRIVQPQNLSSTNTVLIFLFKILKIFPMQIKCSLPSQHLQHVKSNNLCKKQYWHKDSCHLRWRHVPTTYQHKVTPLAANNRCTVCTLQHVKCCFQKCFYLKTNGIRWSLTVQLYDNQFNQYSLCSDCMNKIIWNLLLTNLPCGIVILTVQTWGWHPSSHLPLCKQAIWSDMYELMYMNYSFNIKSWWHSHSA